MGQNRGVSAREPHAQAIRRGVSATLMQVSMIVPDEMRLQSAGSLLTAKYLRLW